jgi:hypothetical protein
LIGEASRDHNVPLVVDFVMRKKEVEENDKGGEVAKI